MSNNLSDICSSSSRDGVGGSSSGTGVVNNGDWICGDVTCRHSNFARRQQCNKCQRDRSLERSSSVGSSGSNKKKLSTEIGKAAAEKSRGLFSAEDWQCNKCANVNWARRSTCNMCNAPKFCDVEERTGFGGGYNDRGVVEYKEREESDSEYDEFGRLKKRRKNSFNNEGSTLKNNPNMRKTIEEEDEEDDEEDDNDDLAKYNLFSDDEEVIPAVKPENKVTDDILKDEFTKSKSNRRSRSRTRSDIRRRQSFSSSRGSTSSSSTSSSTSSSSSSSSSSSTSSSSAETSSQNSRSHELQSCVKKRSYSRSRSLSHPKSLPKRKRTASREGLTRKRSHEKPNSTITTCHRANTSKSRSNSHSSHHSSQSPVNKRNRNSSLSRKHSRSPRSHRKRTTRSSSVTPKRRR